MSPSASQDSVDVDVQVAIVGGGPTGLLTACLLERLGISVCVIDGKKQPLSIGRADALNARTQQCLEIVGILDELLPKGITCNTSSVFANGEFKSRQSHWWNSLKHTYRKNFLMLGQPLVERCLHSRLTTEVFYDEKMQSIAEDDRGVTIETSRGRTIRSLYSVGADGSRSSTRAALDIDFTGTKPQMIWAVLDTFIDTDFPVCSEIITFELDGQSRVAWIPRERELARFYVLLDGEINEKLAKESIQKHMAPYHIEFTHTEWFSTFEIQERIAASFVSRDSEGRVVLAGDAAHVHSVNGGQGLNTGLADAFSLAWRLATVLNNKSMSKESADTLIRSYDTERRAVAREVIDVAAALVRDTTKTGKKYVATIEKNAGYITGMGVSYDGIGSALVRDSEAPNGMWRPGHRCPDVWLNPINGSGALRLYSILSGDYGKHIILLIMKQDWQGARAKVLSRLESCHPGLRFFGIQPRGTLGHDQGEDTTAEGRLDTVDMYSSEWAATQCNLVVVVRPDMYIGFAGENVGDAASFLSYLR